MTTATYRLNNQLNGVEIYFNDKPAREILDELKGKKFRWNGKKLCWYAKQSDETITTAKSMTGEQEAIVGTTQATPRLTNKKAISLVNRLNFIPGTTDISEYHFHTVGSNYTGLSTKETASEVRKHLRKQFSEVKFSVTSTYSKINVEIKSSPYTNIEVEYNNEMTNHRRREEERKLNQELYGILDYCKLLLNSYNYDDSDSMTDYFNTHFYTSVSIDYDYTQTEQTEAIKQDIEDYRNYLIEVREAEEIRKEKEYQEYLKKQEEQKERQKEIDKQVAEEKEYIIDNVEVKEIEEEKQYFVIGSEFAHLNKNSTLKQYQKEVSNGDYSLNTVKITRELHFKDVEALEYFSNQLLSDFDFLAKTGGSYTDDRRVQTMTDYHNMTEWERETVQFNLLGVAVYLDNKLQFLVDTQGYSYSRYVGLVNNVTIENNYKMSQVLTDENIEELKAQVGQLKDISFNVIADNDIIDSWDNEDWKVYRNNIKLKLSDTNIKLNKAIIQQIEEGDEKLKVATYKLLKETDKIQEQFKEADVKQGQRLTLFKTSMLGGVTTTHVTIDKVEYDKYAQYNDNVRLIFNQKGKKGLYSTELYEDVLIYKGWLDIPTTLLNDVSIQNGFTVTTTKFGSYDKEQYNLIIDYLQDNDILPLINTIKPIF